MSATQVIPPPPAPTMPQLRRSTADRMIGGVCGGIGRRYGIDPVVLRVLFVVAVFAAGVGLLLYLALWLLLPTDTDPTPGPLTNNVLGLIVGVLVAVGAVAGTFGWLGSLGAFPGMLVAALLVGLAVWLYQQRDQRPRPVPTAMSSAPAMPSAPSPEWAPPTGFAYGGTGAPAGGYPVAPPPPHPPRERSYLGLFTLLAALVVGTGLAAAAAAGIGSITIVTVLAAMLAVLAVGLLVGTSAGRARWLIALALPLALFLGAVAHIAPIVTAGIPEGVGQRTWTPTGTSQFQLGAGEATLDLTEWAAGPIATQPDGETVSAQLGVGELVVLVPQSWDATIVAQAGVGEITLDGTRVAASGPNERANLTLPATGTTTGSIRLDLDVRAGEISIERRSVPRAALPEQRTPNQDQDRQRGSASNNGTALTKENAR